MALINSLSLTAGVLFCCTWGCSPPASPSIKVPDSVVKYLGKEGVKYLTLCNYDGSDLIILDVNAGCYRHSSLRDIINKVDTVESVSCKYSACTIFSLRWEGMAVCQLRNQSIVNWRVVEFGVAVQMAVPAEDGHSAIVYGMDKRTKRWGLFFVSLDTGSCTFLVNTEPMVSLDATQDLSRVVFTSQHYSEFQTYIYSKANNSLAELSTGSDFSTFLASATGDLFAGDFFRLPNDGIKVIKQEKSHSVLRSGIHAVLSPSCYLFSQKHSDEVSKDGPSRKSWPMELQGPKTGWRKSGHIEDLILATSNEFVPVASCNEIRDTKVLLSVCLR
jgi:hypothetical protein